MSESTNETPVLDLLASMTADSLEASSLDDEALMLVRIAALVAVDAPPASYLFNLGAASEIGIDAEQVRGVLAAIAPIVGTARIASATGNIAEALEVAIEIAEIDEQDGGLNCLRPAGSPRWEGRLRSALRTERGHTPITRRHEMLWFILVRNHLDRYRVLAGPRRRPEGAQLLPVLPVQPGLLPARVARRLHGQRSGTGSGLTSHCFGDAAGPAWIPAQHVVQTARPVGLAERQGPRTTVTTLRRVATP